MTGHPAGSPIVRGQPSRWAPRRAAMLLRGAAAIVAASTMLAPAPALAATDKRSLTSSVPSRPDFSLTVSPSRMVIAIQHTAQPRRFTITNQGRIAVNVVISEASFGTDARGNAVFESHPPHSAAGWIAATPERLHLAAGTAGYVDLRIAVPARTPPGEYQIAIIFAVPPPGGAGISVARSIGAPVYVTVPAIMSGFGSPVSRVTASAYPLRVVIPGGALVAIMALCGVLYARRVRRTRQANG